MTLAQTRRAITTVRGLPVIGWFVNLRVLSVIILLAVWWFRSRSLPEYMLPDPGKVFSGFWEIAVATDRLWVALSISLQALLIGLLLALSVGITLGVLMGSQRLIENIFDTYVNALYVAPVSALAPLLVFYFGIGIEPRIAVVFLFAAPEVIITCYQGAKDTPRTYVEVARAFGANTREIFSKVIVPHEIPYIVTASRLGVGRAIKGVVLAELWILSTGLGELVNEFYTLWETALLMAVILSLILLGLIAMIAIRRVEVAIAPWRET